MGVSQVLVDGPMFFSIKDIKNRAPEVEIRMVANDCYNNYIPRDNGIVGTYVRPEDVEYYSKYISHMEFRTNDLEKERTLVKIYKRGYWPGNLNLLLNKLNYDIDNRGFDEQFAERRINCHQKCQEGRCHYCDIIFSLITNIDRNQDWLREQLS